MSTDSEDMLRAQIVELLQADPVCFGRVSTSTVEALAGLLTRPSSTTSGDAVEHEWLWSLLRGRDDFIVSKGLWSEFVDSLPGAPRGDGDAGRAAAIEECAKIAEQRRRIFVSGPDVRQYVNFAPTEVADAIRALSTVSRSEQGVGSQGEGA